MSYLFKNRLYKKLCISVAVVISLLTTLHVSAQSQAQRTFVYKANAVYTVNTGLGLATQIVLDPSEKVKDFGTGFSSGWDIVRRDHIFYLKPKAPDAETNMYIRTDKRSYIFDLKIVTKDWKRIEEAKLAGAVYLIQFTYPDQVEPLSTPTGFNKDGTPIVPIVPANNPYQSYYMDYDYSASDEAKWLVPIRVYDDGKITYVQMPDAAKAPVFFGRDSDRGEEYLLNSTVTQRIYKLHGVYPFIIIRNANAVVGVRRR
jgi:type IV secretion system protein VirB9